MRASTEATIVRLDSAKAEGLFALVADAAIHPQGYFDMKEGGEALDAEVTGALPVTASIFARCWSIVPIAPVIFGLADETLIFLFRDATRAVTMCAIRWSRPILRWVNMMSFFVRDWDELAQIPDLDRLTWAGGWRICWRIGMRTNTGCSAFDADGTIRACMNFVNMGGKLAEAHPAQLAEALCQFDADLCP